MKYSKMIKQIEYVRRNKEGIILKMGFDTLPSGGTVSDEFLVKKGDTLNIVYQINIDVSNKNSIELASWKRLMDLLGFKEEP